MRNRAKELSQKGDCYYADQFRNPDILIGYERLGRELLEQIPEGIDSFRGAVGGEGMLMGVAKVLKENQPHCRSIALEPASAPVITKGHDGVHTVEGIGIGFLPPLLNKQLYSDTLAIKEGDARATSRRLAKEEGILAGTSTGLNVVAAIELAKQLGPGRAVVTVACDTGLKFVQGDLFTAG
ncbi:hypothetical protein PoHVEF18_003887 [Penicillium ochrochloron]